MVFPAPFTPEIKITSFKFFLLKNSFFSRGFIKEMINSFKILLISDTGSKLGFIFFSAIIVFILEDASTPTSALIKNSSISLSFLSSISFLRTISLNPSENLLALFLKPILNSKNKIEIKEAKAFSSFMMANILRILHPFIPFFTENLWSLNAYKKIFNNFLICSSWPDFKIINKFSKNQNNINDLIEIISNIRSTKAELKITPKLYCDIFFDDESGKLKKLVNKNINLIKQVGRVNNVLTTKIRDKNSIDILVLKEKLSLNFNEDINLRSQKERILQKIETINKKISSLNNKLKNKAYVTNAPKEIVQNDKNLIKELTIEDGKLRSIVSSIN